MLEGLHGVLIKGRHEDHARAALDALRHLQAGEAGHLDVEEGQVGLQRRDALGGFLAVSRGVHDLQPGPQPGQFGRQRAGQVGFVVGDQAGGHGVAGCKGMVMRDKVPRWPPGAGSSSNCASGP